MGPPRPSLWLRIAPLPDGLLEFGNAESTVIVDRNGEVLYEARADGGSRTRLLRADALPPTLVAATVAAEDHRFWSHHGVDPLAIGRAARAQRPSSLFLRRRIHDHAAGREAAAGARQTAGPPAPRGLSTKIREAVLALRLEHRLDKREILALYLNLAPYGNQIAGAEAREPRLLRLRRGAADAGAGGVSRRAAAAAVTVQSVPRS